MTNFVYRAKFEPGERSGIVVTFPDVPEAITQGDDMADARAMAEEALGLALLTYPRRNLPLPKPHARSRGLIAVTVSAPVAAKLAVLEAFRRSGMSRMDLARAMDKDEKAIRRILDPKHGTRIDALEETLRALGHRLVVGVEKAA